MLPSRSRLERWNPDSLTFTGQAVKDGGVAVDNAVTTLSTNIATMPDTKAWSGDAHTAATSMFDRAQKQTDAFSTYATAVGEALISGAGTIGPPRTALLNKADQIDMSGQLRVNEQWVVLIAGAQMTIEQVAALERRAQAEQVIVNGLLTAVGSADDTAAAALTDAAQPHGFVPPNPLDPGSLMIPGSQRPGDEVPDPLSPLGAIQQGLVRDTEMSQTVRETTTEKRYDPMTGEELATVTTIYMQDGSKHVRTANANAQFSDRGPATTEIHYDKDGNEISKSTSVTFNEFAHHSIANADVTTIQMADGTITTLIERPDGSRTGTIRTPDGRQADVPVQLLSNPALMTIDAGITGLGAQAEHGIPMLSQEALEHVKTGAKYGGPAFGLATALWDVAVADTGFQKCVAAAEGATSLTAGALAGVATSGGGPVTAVLAATVAAGGGKALGNWIGNTFCPR